MRVIDSHIGVVHMVIMVGSFCLSLSIFLSSNGALHLGHGLGSGVGVCAPTALDVSSESGVRSRVELKKVGSEDRSIVIAFSLSLSLFLSLLLCTCSDLELRDR